MPRRFNIGTKLLEELVAYIFFDHHEDGSRKFFRKAPTYHIYDVISIKYHYEARE
jgi:hypothetical protein